MQIMEISREEILSKLKGNKTRYLHELEELQQEDNSRKYFSNDVGMYCISQMNKGRLYCMFAGQEKFDKEFFLGVMKKIYTSDVENVTISINCKELEEEDICALGYSTIGYYKSFIFDGTAVGNDTRQMIELCAEHADYVDYVDKCEFPAQKGRPDFKTLFRIFVLEKEGRILVFLENNKIVGYLSFLPSIEGVMDVDYIYVDSEYRNKGIARDLAQQYAFVVTKQGMLPYWGNAIHDASEKTAKSAGFRCCSEHYYFEKK